MRVQRALDGPSPWALGDYAQPRLDPGSFARTPSLGWSGATGRYPGLAVAVLCDLEDVTVRRVDRVLFEGLSLTVSAGERIGVVGSNGTGKSTLLGIVAGTETPDAGQVRRERGRASDSSNRCQRCRRAPCAMPWARAGRRGAALDRLGVGSDLDADVATLSGGQAKRVSLARVLAHPVDLLVLDEPTNHLDLGAVAWLERWLASFRGGLVLVTHDRHLLDRVTTQMLEIERGHGYVHEGSYSAYLEARATREGKAAADEATRRNLARRELAWFGAAPRHDRASPERGVDAAMRLLEGGPDEPPPSTALTAAGTPRLGDKVIECAGVGFAYRAGQPVVRDVSLVVSRRARLGIVGANGSGKSTLLDLMAGRLRPDVGTVEVGATVVVGYYDQQGVELDPGARVQELVAGPFRSPGTLPDIELMKRFGFVGELPFTRVGTLSGGERRRLQLLMVLAAQPNVLFLDEPTNDLDLETLRMLESFADDWPGALVVVSHDRTFLERTTERIVAVEADGSVAEVPGGVSAWVHQFDHPAPQRGAALGSAGKSPLSARARTPRSSSGTRAPGRLLREAEKQVSRLERQRATLTESLTATTDYLELNRLGEQLSAVQSELYAAEEQWLSLAEEAERDRT